MEIILAIVVGLAVIFFGALISMGNERQRKAIDSLREQVILWAIQDLRIKHERLARGVNVDDPIGWLSGLASKFSGYDRRLEVVETFDEPLALVCTFGEGYKKIVFSPCSPADIHKFTGKRKKSLSGYVIQNPLFLLPRSVVSYEFSILNAGVLFDVEFPIAWKSLTGHTLNNIDRLWMYET